MEKRNLYQHLIEYSKSGRYPMHMPGHKRNPEFFMENPYQIDVTEVEDTDNLHHPEGIIKELMEQMKNCYKTEKTYPLVGGSTCGILVAISACCRRGDTILMARNSHRSVYHAVYLLELRPIYLYPEEDEKTGIALGISKEQVEKQVEQHPEISCVIVTSPTYEGVLSDIKALADFVHKKDIPLIVDEAHGAHLHWSVDEYKSAISLGADLVIQSLHKTLPCFTQTGVLHRCSQRISEEIIERYLAIYETSSPSYILMAGIATCMDWLEKKGKDAFLQYNENRNLLVQSTKTWKVLSLWEHQAKEPSKLVILTGNSGKTGQQLAELLRREHNIEVEMAAAGYVLAMTSVADTREGFVRFAHALTQIDEKWKKEKEQIYLYSKGQPKSVHPEVAMSIYEAMNGSWETISLEKSEGRISAEYAFIYPPGIPFLVPGERIRKEIMDRIQSAKKMKLELMGLSDEDGKQIRVCKERGK